MMKPLPSATITAMAGSPCSATPINCANRSGAMNFGSLSSMVSSRAIEGKKLIATAGACRKGTALNACTVMFSDRKTSTGASTARGINSIKLER